MTSGYASGGDPAACGCGRAAACPAEPFTDLGRAHPGGFELGHMTDAREHDQRPGRVSAGRPADRLDRNQPVEQAVQDQHRAAGGAIARR